MASALVIVDKVYGVYVQGHLSYVGILDVDGRLRVDLNNNMQGKLKGTIHTPVWLGSITLADAILYAQVYDDANYSNDYIIGAIQAPLFGFESAAKFDLHTGDIDWHADMSLIGEVDVPPPLGKGMLLATSLHSFTLPPGLDGVIFEADWDENDTDLNLTRPDATVITPANVDTFADVKYFKDSTSRKALYAVTAPEGGSWDVEVTNDTGIGGYTVRSLKKTGRPVIEILTPASDVSSSPVAITWTDADSDSDASIDLFFDVDRQGADGIPIVAGLSEDDTANSYSWDTTGVTPGTYYVYAKIDDGTNLPTISYSIGRVTITDPSAPAAPTDLAAVAGPEADEITLSWTAPAGTIDHYDVWLNPDAAGEGYPLTISAGDDTEVVIGSLTPGEQYRVTVVSVDDADATSVPASPVLVTVPSATNHIPVFTGTIPSQATVGSLYQHQVLSADLDVDTIQHGLTDEPAGMTITTGGQIDWTPSSNELGLHTFTVTLDDGNGGTNQQQFTIHVADATTANREPEILSQAPSEIEPSGNYGYPVITDDPNTGDSVTVQLLSGPTGAAMNGNTVEWTAGSTSGWNEFLIKAIDQSGVFTLQRFSVLVDGDLPALNVSDWGTAEATATDAIEVTADNTPDTSGAVQFLFEQDSTPGSWQDARIYTASGLTRQRGLRIGWDASAAVLEGDSKGVELANSFWAV